MNLSEGFDQDALESLRISEPIPRWRWNVPGQRDVPASFFRIQSAEPRLPFGFAIAIRVEGNCANHGLIGWAVIGQRVVGQLDQLFFAIDWNDFEAVAFCAREQERLPLPFCSAVCRR